MIEYYYYEFGSVADANGTEISRLRRNGAQDELGHVEPVHVRCRKYRLLVENSI